MMNKITKKFISVLVALAMLAAMSAVAVATEGDSLQKAPGYIFTDNTTTTDISGTKVAALYNAYSLRLPTGVFVAAGTDSYVDALISLCEPVTDAYMIGEVLAQSFTSDTLAQYLYQCEGITEISKIGDVVYVGYTATNGFEIILAYAGTGLLNKAAYNPAEDKLVQFIGNEATAFGHFREGTHMEMSEALMNEIDERLAVGDIASLEANPDIEIVYDENGGRYIEPASAVFRQGTSSSVSFAYGSAVDSADAPSLSAMGFSNDAAMLNNLKAVFPQYTNAVKATYSKPCGALGQSITVRVKGSRNNYSKVTADYATFYAGYALALVVTFLSLPVSTVVAILTVLGVSVSGGSTLLQSATLVRSAIYRFDGAKHGYVYDTTVYNADVRVDTNYGAGRFTGGYTNSGEFTWVYSQICPAFDISNATIANTAANAYNADIVMYGLCYNYYPV
jgi:hypothetical protein